MEIMALPTNMSFGTVIGRFLRAVIDGAGVDRDPDGIPLDGLVIRFTPSRQVFKNLTDTLGPMTIVADPIVATTDENGVVVGPDGIPGIRLVATDDPDLIPTGWTWSVNISGSNLPGAISFSMALPSNSTVDLTTVIPVPPNPGQDLAPWLAAVQVAQEAQFAAANSASEAAAHAAEVEAVTATNDGIMTSVASDPQSTFSARLGEVIAGSSMYAATPPPYAGARLHSYDPALRLYNGESPEMVSIRQIVSRAKRGDALARIVMPGDSRVRGAGLPGTPKDFGLDSLPAQLRDILGAREGEIYIDPLDSRIVASGFALYANPDGNYSALAPNVEGTVTITLPQSTGFDLWGFRTGSTVSATVAVDGAAPETFTPGTGAAWKRFTKTGLSNTAHTVVINVPAGAGNWSLLKITPSYPTPVLTVANAGRSSSNPAHWDDVTWNKLLPSIIGSNLDLPDVAIVQIGTNWGSSTYANLQSIVTKLRAAAVKVMLASFGPRAEDSTNPLFDERRGYQYDLADEFNLPLLDHLQVVGDWGTANGRGLFADTVHENIGGLSLEASATGRALAL